MPIRHPASRSAPRRRRLWGLEACESRQLLAVGPYVHTHNVDQLAVVDAANGSIEILSRMSGFAEDDSRMADIAFSPTGRLYGITRDWLYEIDPVTAELTALGQHGIPQANALAFESDGTLNAMGFSSPALFEITFSDTAITRVRQRATLSGVSSTTGANGDIVFANQDLVVATADNRLIFYRFDVNPDRPRVVRDINLSVLNVDNLFGLALVSPTQLYATTDDAVIKIDVSNANQVGITRVTVTNTTFGDMRGASYYAEAGGPVPVGTLSGIKWHDRNGDGIRQSTEPVLTDWPVYLDLDLDGVVDTTEPVRRTDGTGRYYFFGKAPGFYTVDEIIEDADAWEQSAPLSPHRNLVGDYDFSTTRPLNELFHSFGLPDLTASAVNVGGGNAILTSASSFLELPVALGAQPFTIAIDATYNATIASTQYLVSQRQSGTNVDRDFDVTAAMPTKSLAASFCNSAGTCPTATQGTLDSARHVYAITWDGSRLGMFLDDTLVTQTVSGTRPDLDGQVVRFGNPFAQTTAAGLRGTLHGIRIFNAALGAADLEAAFGSAATASAYSVWLDDVAGIDGLNFGNREPVVVELVPEIEIRRDTANGSLIVDGGDPIDLGRIVAGEPSPTATFWIKNTGTATLNLSSVTAPSGWTLTGPGSSSLPPGASTTVEIRFADNLTPGIRSGELTIQNNDADENPFNIPLFGEVLAEDTRPRALLINTSNGGLLRIDPATGIPQTLISSGTVLTDIAYHPTENKLYGVNNTSLYEIDLAAKSVTPLFAHGVAGATSLGFSPAGEMFLAAQDVHRVNLVSRSVQFYASGGSAPAGDLAFLGSRMYLSTITGDLYEVRSSGSTKLGSVGTSLHGLAALDPDTLIGFASNQAYSVNLSTLAIAPLYNSFIFTINGATDLPDPVAHNVARPNDVTGDGLVVPLDALLIINELNAHSFTDPVTGRILSSPTGLTRYPDVNNDGFVNPIDALLVINELNGAAAATVAAVPATTAVDQVWSDIGAALGGFAGRPRGASDDGMSESSL